MSEATAIGHTLRAARERLGLGLDQAAERLHVDPQVIEALEGGRFTTLGAPVFVRGHLRRYAELLGEDDGPLQARYASMQESSIPPDLTRLPTSGTPQAPAPAARWPLVVAAVLLVLGAIVWWAMRMPRG